MIYPRNGQSHESQAPLAAGAACRDAMQDIPEFTPEQLRWLKAQTQRFEDGYEPTRSLIPGL